MNKFLKKVIASTLGAFSVVVNSVILYLFLHLIDLKMLKAGYLEGAGTGQFFRVILGIPALFLIGVLWIGFIIFVFSYYFDGLEKNRLIERFSLISAIEFFIIPVIVILFLIAFSAKPQSYEITIFVLASVLGIISLAIHRWSKNNNMIEDDGQYEEN